MVCHLLELLKFEGTVVHGRRQTEAILHEVDLAGTVATIHGMYLRHTHVALVDDHQVILREKVEQAVGTSTGFASVKVARVVLDTRAVAQLAQHLHIIGDTFVEALGLKGLAYLAEVLDLTGEVVLNLIDGLQRALLAGHEEVGGVYLVAVVAVHAHAAHGVYLLDGVDLVVPELYAQCIVGVGEVDVHGVALDAEVAAPGVEVVAHVEAVHQAAQQHVAVELHAHVHLDHAVVELGRVAHTVYTGD